MIVTKFGGTSVASADRINTICTIVKNNAEKQPIIVVSAIRGITDLLLSLANTSKAQQKEILNKIKKKHYDLVSSIWGNNQIPVEVTKYIDDRLQEIKIAKEKANDKKGLDHLVSYGEILSSFIISKVLEMKGLPSQQIIATHIITTNNNFSAAEFLPELTRKNAKKIIEPLIQKNIIPVITGFIGSTQDGHTTTLGRGGSDYTAAILGYALNAQEIQIWTDVDGVFTTDPKIVKDAVLIPHISYKEASEMATFGAKVLHPRTIKPAIHAGIPVRVLNTFNPDHPGTSIESTPANARAITAVTCKKSITLVNIYAAEMFLQKGYLAQIFAIFAKHNISVNLVSVSEVSVSITLDNDENLKDAVTEVSTFAQVTTTKNFGMISLIGEGIVGVSHILKNIFTILDKSGIAIKMLSLGATDINISFITASKHIEPAVAILHNQLIRKSVTKGAHL